MPENEQQEEQKNVHQWFSENPADRLCHGLDKYSPLTQVLVNYKQINW